MNDTARELNEPLFFRGLLNAIVLTGLAVGAIVALASASGCAAPGGDGSPTPAQVWDYATNRIDSALSGAGGASSQDAHGAHAESDVPQPGGDAGDAAAPEALAQSPQSPQSGDDPSRTSRTSRETILWKYGGVDGNLLALGLNLASLPDHHRQNDREDSIPCLIRPFTGRLTLAERRGLYHAPPPTSKENK